MPTPDQWHQWPSTMSINQAAAPTALAPRSVLLDSLRGIALLGILLMNIECYTVPLNAGTSGLNPALTGSDRWVDALTYLFVQGKFYTLFALLFGAGFAIMESRALRAQRPFVPFFLRRMALLLLIGLTHAIFLWAGDILVTYAFWGCVLLAVRRLPTAFLPLVALVLYFSVPLTLVFYAVMAALMQQLPGQAEIWRHIHDQTAHDVAVALQAQRFAIEHASYGQACRQRLADFAATCNALVSNGLAVFAFFLLGRWFVEAGILCNPSRWSRAAARVRWCVWPAGLLCMAVSIAIEPTMDAGSLTLSMAVAYLLWQAANVMMCVGYVAWFAHFTPAYLHVFASAGRMSLSLYVMQSLICTWLFSHYGLGLYADLSRAWQAPFAVGFFALQWLFSRWWFKHFQFGPLEWLLRSASYWQWMPLRRCAT